MKNMFLLFVSCSCTMLQAVDGIKPAERPLGLTSLTVETPNTRLRPSQDVPAWLDGTFVRNGPAVFNVGPAYLPHWLDGLAMLHSFRFSKGDVYYKSRFLRSSQYEKMIVEKSLIFPGFGQDKPSVGNAPDSIYIPNANINIAKFAASFVALTEAPLPVIFDLDTLDTAGLFTYSDLLPQSRIWQCAHPQYEAETGDIISYHVEFFPAKYVIYRMKKETSKRVILAEIPVEEPAYMHSFALTTNYVVLVEFPLFVNPVDTLKGGSFSSHYKWKGNKPMRILVVSRKTGDLVGTYLAEPVFAWHHINSFEEDGTLVIDMAAYPDAGVFVSPEVVDDPDHKRVGRFVRYKVSLADKKVLKEEVGPAIEMPRINYGKYNGKPYNFVYGYDDSHADEVLKKRGLVKIDSKTKHSISWSEDNCIADEPVFVANPNPKSEDDGVLLACVLDTKKRLSFLLILDAKRMKEIARMDVPHHIPYGLHGDFIPRL